MLEAGLMPFIPGTDSMLNTGAASTLLPMGMNTPYCLIMSGKSGNSFMVKTRSKSLTKRSRSAGRMQPDTKVRQL